MFGGVVFGTSLIFAFQSQSESSNSSISGVSFYLTGYSSPNNGEISFYFKIYSFGSFFTNRVGDVILEVNFYEF